MRHPILLLGLTLLGACSSSPDSNEAGRQGMDDWKPPLQAPGQREAWMPDSGASAGFLGALANFRGIDTAKVVIQPFLYEDATEHRETRPWAVTEGGVMLADDAVSWLRAALPKADVRGPEAVQKGLDDKGIDPTAVSTPAGVMGSGHHLGATVVIFGRVRQMPDPITSTNRFLDLDMQALDVIDGKSVTKTLRWRLTNADADLTRLFIDLGREAVGWEVAEKLDVPVIAAENYEQALQRAQQELASRVAERVAELAGEPGTSQQPVISGSKLWVAPTSFSALSQRLTSLDKARYDLREAQWEVDANAARAGQPVDIGGTTLPNVAEAVAYVDGMEGQVAALKAVQLSDEFTADLESALASDDRVGQLGNPPIIAAGEVQRTQASRLALDLRVEQMRDQDLVMAGLANKGVRFVAVPYIDPEAARGRDFYKLSVRIVDLARPGSYAEEFTTLDRVVGERLTPILESTE